MEQTANEQKPKSPKAKSTMKKLDPAAIKLLSQLKERANKKDFGRKVREKDILTVALKQVTDAHLKELQEATLSEKDRLALAHQHYQEHHGKITMDQFIGKLLKGEISKQEEQRNS